MQHHVFLSYGREDTPIMQHIRDALRAAGLRVWTDENLSPGTHSWKTGIETAIENSGVLVVVMSPASKESEWVERELDYARVQGIEILPVLARGAEGDSVPFQLISTQWVDLRDETLFDVRIDALVATIRAHIGDEPISPIPVRSHSRRRRPEATDDESSGSLPVTWIATAGVIGIVALLMIVFVILPGDDSPGSEGITLETLTREHTPTTIVRAATDISPTIEIATEVAQAATDIPAITASGAGKIVFGSERDGNNEIYVMNADGSNPVNISNHHSDDFSPSWSTDGSRVVFHSRRDADDANPENRELYIMDADGGNLQRLTDHPADDRNGMISPDGSQIVFQSDRDGDTEIYILSLVDDSLRQLTDNNDEDNDPAWSPDGAQVIFESNHDGDLDLYVLDLNCGSPQACQNSIRGVTDNSVNDANPDWSPDGTRIVYQSQTQRGEPFEIFVFDFQTSVVEQLTFSTVENFEPAWSPDGTQIVYHAFPRPDVTDNREIYVMDADGSNVLRLTTAPGNDWSADWTSG